MRKVILIMAMMSILGGCGDGGSGEGTGDVTTTDAQADSLSNPFFTGRSQCRDRGDRP